MLSLIGIVIVVVGFMARMNPLLVVTVAALVTGVAGGMGPVQVIETFGKAFQENRYVSVVWVVLPVIGLLERAGLQERAKTLIGQIRAATTGRLLLLYFVLRQATAALGLTSLGGHAQMVRPLIAPMAEAAAETTMARWTTTPANRSAPTPPPSTTSPCSSARIFSSPSPPSC